MTNLKAAVVWMAVVLLCLGGAGCEPWNRGGGEEEDPDYQAGLNHKRAGRAERAVGSFERALQRNPRSASAHFELGLLYYQGVTNYVRALNHFDHVKRLRPDHPHIQAVDQMMRVCMQELVRNVPFGTITDQMRRDLERLERLERENAELRRQLDQARSDLTTARSSPGTTPRGGSPGSRQGASPAPAPGTVVGDGSGPVAGAGGTYQVQRGDTIYSIARGRGIPPSTLVAMNPGIDPNRIQPGQVLRVPSR